VTILPFFSGINTKVQKLEKQIFPIVQ